MKPLHLCVPVLRRYDLLRELLLSLRLSDVQPTQVHVIDNGRNPLKLANALHGLEKEQDYDIFIPDAPMGVAMSWNWFILNTPEERLIVNDDVTFATGSLKAMMDAPGECVTALRGHAFSCFILRDACVDKVGLFDDTISPGYGYFEDCDYEERMYALGMFLTHVDCGVGHVQSATLAVAPNREEHDQRFLMAQHNFVTKWGRMPRGMEQQA